jgi:hypothetical protein
MVNANTINVLKENASNNHAHKILNAKVLNSAVELLMSASLKKVMVDHAMLIGIVKPDVNVCLFKDLQVLVPAKYLV